MTPAAHGDLLAVHRAQGEQPAWRVELGGVDRGVVAAAVDDDVVGLHLLDESLHACVRERRPSATTSVLGPGWLQR